MDMGQYEKIEKLTERITRLEKDTRRYWSNSLDQEARITELETKISELEEWKYAHNLNHSVGK